MKQLGLPLLSLILGSCVANEKPYTHYLLDPQVVIPKQMVDEGGEPVPKAIGPDERSIKTRWNDGKTYTELDIPVLSSGQRIVIEHDVKAPQKQQKGPEVPMAAPSVNDTSHAVMHNAYLARGLSENAKAPEISLSQARIKVNEATRGRNYALALQMIEKVLARYPEHPEFLRAKGSVLLLLGEVPQAVETYEKAQDIEFDPSVERKLKELDR